MSDKYANIKYFLIFNIINSGEFTPAELWKCFIDDEVQKLITDHTNQYAHERNAVNFIVTTEEMQTFIGILYITGYNRLPNINAYWATRKSVGNMCIKDAMSRTRFKQIKSFIHVCDNRNLDKADKFAKVSPLNKMLNDRFMQFGVFAHNLSIDEQMISYYGRHSCKMFMKGKPIRFGYKHWVLASAEGYCFQYIPYGGATANKNENMGLGEKVVLELMSHVTSPGNHNVTFDNFFTSYKLMYRLSELGHFATGTVRENRTSGAPLTSVKNMKKKATDRGTYEYCFERNKEIYVVRWKDSSVSICNFFKT